MKISPDFRPASMIRGYHAHLYYNGSNKQWAGHLRREIARLFPTADIGRWRDMDNQLQALDHDQRYNGRSYNRHYIPPPDDRSPGYPAQLNRYMACLQIGRAHV